MPVSYTHLDVYKRQSKDKALRGSKDGFVETLVFNTALIRRRIRSPKLSMEHMTAGRTSQTDIVLCYMENRIDRRLLREMCIRDRIRRGRRRAR